MKKAWLLLVLLVSVCGALSGGWDSVRTLHLRGTLEVGELKGAWESWLDLRESRYWIDQQAGPIREVSGWNGRVSWSEDETGDVWIADSEEARRQALLTAYVDTFAYLSPQRFPAKVTKKHGYLEIVPQDAEPIGVWPDRVTHLARRVKELTGVNQSTLIFDDFRKVGELVLPFDTMETGIKPEEVHWRMKTLSVEVDQTLPPAIFDPPETKPAGLEFPPGQDSVTLNYRSSDGYIFLPVSINGKLRDNFIFDIGSTNTIAPRHAKEMGLTVRAAGFGYGGGPDAEAAGVTEVARLEVGGLVMRDQWIDTSELPVAAWDGLIGYELARRAVVTIDYAGHRIIFTKPEAFHKPEDAVALALRSASRSEILVEAVVDGHPGEFQLDTGQDSGLTINRPFAQRSGLLAKHRTGPRGGVAGIGGKTDTVGFVPNSFEMGSLRPLTMLAQIMRAKSGSGAEEHVDGGIGNGILRQFTVTLDYGNRVVYFEKNADYQKPEGSWRQKMKQPTTGGWLGLTDLACQRDSCEIVALLPGGAASAGGVMPGDVLLALNGRSLADLNGEQMTGILYNAPGTEVTLTIRRGEVKRDVKLVSAN